MREIDGATGSKDSVGGMKICKFETSFWQSLFRFGHGITFEAKIVK